MKISNFKYILTDIGGGWNTIHTFYGVTHDGEVYTTRKFDDNIFQLDTHLECEYLGKLDSLELGLKDKSELNYWVMDAPDLTLYEVGETFKVLHYAPEVTVNNPKIYNEIQRLVLAYSGIEIADKYANNDNFIIGEIKTADEFRNTLNLLNTGHQAITTFHASDCKEAIEKIIEQLIQDEASDKDKIPLNDFLQSAVSRMHKNDSTLIDEVMQRAHSETDVDSQEMLARIAINELVYNVEMKK